MYAAAGGASLASRQARKRQQQQNNKQKLLQQQKLAAARSGVSTPTRLQQSRQFHQLPSSYLRTPQAQARKLSASYARQSQLLLPIVEGNNQQHQQQQQHQHQQYLHSHQHFHPHQHQHYDVHSPRPLSPKPGAPGTPGTPIHHRHHLPQHHHHHLTKSATASFPLVSQAEATPPSTPTLSVCKQSLPPGISVETSGTHVPHPQNQIQLPCPQDSIIVTPATPIASPGHKPTSLLPTNDNVLTADAVPTGQLERKCSFYRIRRTDALEQEDNYSLCPGGATITTAHQLDAYTDDNLIYSGLPNGGNDHKWAQTAYCEQGICTCCEQIEDRQMTLSLSINGVQQYLFLTENGLKCAQGRAAWLERGRRCSVQDSNSASCHRRWKRNRIHDSSLGGSSDDEDFLGVLRGPSSFANAFLYVGLGTIAIGLVIAFVGTGEKGFKTVELRLIGPSLIGIGLICCILRICFCICPSHCISSSRRARKKNNNKIDADHTTSLLRGDSKRVSIAKGPHLQKIPLTHKRGSNKMLNEGMEALRQIATTSLFLQNEQKPSANRVVPIIKEPEKPSEEAPLEMRKLNTATLNITDVSDDEDEEDEAAAPSSSYNKKTESLIQSSQGKLARQRLSTNQQKNQCQHEKLDPDTILMETSLTIIDPTTSSNLPPSSPPPSTSKAFMSSQQNYNLPSPIPHRYPISSTVTSTMNATSSYNTEQPQHTPGQILDTRQDSKEIQQTTTTTNLPLLQLPSSPLTLTISSSILNSSSNQNQRYHQPASMLTATTATTTNTTTITTTTTTTSTLPTIANVSSKSHYSSSTFSSPPPPTINSEPELVLSPANLGQ